MSISGNMAGARFHGYTAGKLQSRPDQSASLTGDKSCGNHFGERTMRTKFFLATFLLSLALPAAFSRPHQAIGNRAENPGARKQME